MASYIALIRKEADSDYGVSFPDFPGCVTAGSTLDEARTNAAEALALHIEGMIEDKEALPEASELATVMADRENRDSVAIMIDAPEAKAVRVNVILPEDGLNDVDAFAARKGFSRSGLLMKAARQYIHGYSVNPADRTIMHTETATVWKYDDKERLRFVWSFRKLDGSQKHQLGLGAMRALRQERSRPTMVKGYWADRSGRMRPARDS